MGFGSHAEMYWLFFVVVFLMSMEGNMLRRSWSSGKYICVRFLLYIVAFMRWRKKGTESMRRSCVVL